MTTPIGIDLGTTFSCVAYVEPGGGRAIIIPGPDGTNTTASAVAWQNGDLIVGMEAKELQKFATSEVSTYFKRAMGDPDWSVELGGETYSAPQLSSLVLKALRDRASEHLGEDVTEAVITVPAYFDDIRRQATLEAARLAGLETLALINEPTAAALAYGIRPNSSGGFILVYDLGGGTFDVTLAEVTETDLIVRATAGNHELGGKDWDDKIISALSIRFENDFGQSPDSEDLDAIRIGAENLKRSLSQVSTSKIQLTSGGQSATYDMSREEFQDISQDLLELTRALTEEVLREAGAEWHQVTHVVPVGGSTRMPMVHEFLENMTGRPPTRGVHPDEAVALGAAVRAAIELEKRDPSSSGPKFSLGGPRNISDVMSHSLGTIATNDDNSAYVNSHLIRKNQTVPANETRPYRLPLSGQRENKLDVYVTQGELTDPQAVTYLDVYSFTGIPSTGAKEAIIDLTFGYDENGVVQVSAVDSATSTSLTMSREQLPHDVPERFLGSPQDTKAAGEATIYLVFDVSGSMSGTPLSEAQKAAKEFMKTCALGPVKIGIMCVSDSTSVLQTPSDDFHRIEYGIDSLAVALTGYGNGAHPFDELKKELANRDSASYAVVLADGIWSRQDAAVESAKKCHKNNINVIGVGFGSADEKFLRDISNMDLGGLTDLSQLTETFTTIAQEIGGGGTSESNSGGFLQGLRR